MDTNFLGETKVQIGSQRTSTQLRVLFVLGTLWGGNGVTSHLRTLSLGLIQHGIEVAIVSGLASMTSSAHSQALNSVEEFRNLGINYFIIPFSTNLSALGVARNLVGIVESLDAAIQAFKPNLIHLHSLSVVPYIHLLRIRHKIPFVSTCHAQPNPTPIKSGIIRVIHRLLPNLFGDRFIAISSEQHKIFEQFFHLPSKKIKRIYHGVDSEYFHPPSPEERVIARESFGIEIKEQVVCLIGRLDPQKGHKILVQAMSILKSQGISPVALFAGNGYLDEVQNIKNCATQNNLLNSVKLLGMVDSRQVLWASDVLVLPSQTEAFGLVIPEAMLCGVVPIRTPSGGAFDQIVQGVNGFITAFSDPNSLAKNLDILLTDNCIREKMAANAFEVAKANFTVEIMVNATIDLYSELLSCVKV
jgi:glycosyltransferase involved in cell wall biosynthesis